MFYSLLNCFLLIGFIIQIVYGIDLGSLKGTKSPRLTKYTQSPTKSSPTLSTLSLYRINSTAGTTCVLIQTDALLTIRYRNKYGEDVEADTFIPDDPQLSGDCSESDYESIKMKFKGFVLDIYYQKTPGGERWYISGMDLTYSSSNPIFEHIDRPNLNVKLSTKPQSMYFPTPVGKSYSCHTEQEILMYAPADSDDKSGHIAKLYLRETRMQSFMYKANGLWGPVFVCSATGSYRDETAPLAVGTTLAVFVLITIGGYAVWRYFKVKKVQYGTME
ncbi:uncharacterized protein LOC129609107 [Condylostylus longicornis]|uniref:uncharacterized protein LOC129609107 n=1 Tax=Condylostylus longicornis TaxID=2530218 RepID=UPI00244DD884|nr:uncharacterized protein LOC129609107 [Condylostylus longicornis]